MLLNQFLLLSAFLFCVGAYGVMVRRHAVLVLMSIGEGLTQRMSFEPDMTTERFDPFLRDVVTRMLRPRDGVERISGNGTRKAPA